jgi:FAD synthetase
MAAESKRGPVRVFVAGTFDGLHLGHVFLLDFARRRGSALARRQRRDGVRVSVAIARDDSVERLKHRRPLHSHRERQRLVAALRSVDEAFVGVPTDFLRSVRRVRPDLIVLGHDQSTSWEERLRAAGIHVPILRCPPYRRANLKSSALRRDFEKMAT